MSETPVLDVFEKKWPIATTVARMLTPAVIERIRAAPKDQPVGNLLREIAPIIEDTARRDPVVVNDMGAEKPWQSGTTLGMAGGLLTSLGAIYAMLASGTVDPAALGPVIASALACAWGLYRRWWPGLAPLFSRGK